MGDGHVRALTARRTSQHTTPTGLRLTCVLVEDVDEPDVREVLRQALQAVGVHARRQVHHGARRLHQVRLPRRAVALREAGPHRPDGPEGVHGRCGAVLMLLLLLVACSGCLLRQAQAQLRELLLGLHAARPVGCSLLLLVLQLLPGPEQLRLQRLHGGVLALLSEPPPSPPSHALGQGRGRGAAGAQQPRTSDNALPHRVLCAAAAAARVVQLMAKGRGPSASGARTREPSTEGRLCSVQMLHSARVGSAARWTRRTSSARQLVLPSHRRAMASQHVCQATQVLQQVTLAREELVVFGMRLPPHGDPLPVHQTAVRPLSIAGFHNRGRRQSWPGSG